jgi:hypothetical protein
MGQTSFYGADNGGAKAGWAKEYERAATGGENANQDPFAIHLEDQADLNALYGKEAVAVGQSVRSNNGTRRN